MAFLWHFEFRTYGKSHMHLVDIFRFRTTIIAFGAHETSHQIVGQRISLSPLKQLTEKAHGNFRELFLLAKRYLKRESRYASCENAVLDSSPELNLCLHAGTAAMDSVEVKSPPIETDPRTAGYQRWSKLTFIHWRVEADLLQRQLPSGLTIQQFDGSAWLGVVPFSMERIRPWWSPPVPGVSWFLETNVRTYVIDHRGIAGVWFFSLDANCRIAVNIARSFWHLPYKHAAMSLNSHIARNDKETSQHTYTGVRKDLPAAEYEIWVTMPQEPARTAQPETLDYFLLERYLLFAGDRRQRIRAGRVHHSPYQFVTPDSVSGLQTLTNTVGCDPLDLKTASHFAYCEGVDVRVSPLKLQN